MTIPDSLVLKMVSAAMAITSLVLIAADDVGLGSVVCFEGIVTFAVSKKLEEN